MSETLPSFSMVLETANLELADLANLRLSLDSIAAQNVNIAQAREILMVHGGDVPVDLMAHLSHDYPWLRVFHVPEGTGYGQAKMMGTQACTGEVIVFFDSDCVYESGWLRGLLGALAEYTDIGAVSGETQMGADTAVGLASSVLFTFQTFTYGDALYDYPRLHLNSAAFRREILLANPIHSHTDVMSAGGVSTMMFVRGLRKAGVKVVRSPFSRAVHAPPNGLRHFCWRFLNMGHDAVNFYRLEARQKRDNLVPTAGRGRLFVKFFSLAGERLKVTHTKMRDLLRQKPARWRLLPLALPLLALGIALQVTGYLSGMIAPRLLPSLAPEEMKRGTTYEAATQEGKAGTV